MIWTPMPGTPNLKSLKYTGVLCKELIVSATGICSSSWGFLPYYGNLKLNLGVQNAVEPKT